MTAPAGPRGAEAPLAGILLICLAVLSFVIMNTMVKHLSQTLPVPLIIWARYFFHLVLIMVLFPRRLPTLLVSGRKGMQVLRSVLVLVATMFMFFAVSLMPLADVVAISFTAPLLVTGLSVPVLGEHVGPRRWAAVGAGFVGMLIIVRPGAGVFQWAALLPLGMAVCYATYQLITRKIRGAADPLNALFYTALVGAVATTLAVPFFWVTPAPLDWPLLVGTGLFGGLGHFAIIRAYEQARPAMIAPFSYTELIWAVLLGFFVFGDLPDAWTFGGGAIIVASGLYVLHRERGRAAVASSEPGPAPGA